MRYMGCGNHGHGDDNCVCTVLRAIVDAQDKVSPTGDSDCLVSCERSIEELLAGAQRPSNDLNTIPVILYCGDCAPFQGFGVKVKDHDNGNGGGGQGGNRGDDNKLECVSTFLFRVNSVDDNCCAKLELLSTNHGKGKKNKDNDLCEQLDNVKLDEIEGTDICITVDLNCFCAVTCLDPIAL
jgi:hypothetical protein